MLKLCFMLYASHYKSIIHIWSALQCSACSCHVSKMIFCYSYAFRSNHTLKGWDDTVTIIILNNDHLATYWLFACCMMNTIARNLLNTYIIEQILLVLLTKKFLNKTPSFSSEYAKSLLTCNNASYGLASF